MKLFLCFAAFATALALAEPPPIAQQRPDGTPNRAVWMAAGRIGVMVHYLPTPVGATRAEQQASVDRAVDAFDLEGFLQQLDEAGADWLIFTLTQVNGVLNSANPKLPPDATMIVPRRDLAFEIAQRRHAAGKRVILYLPSDNDGSMLIRLVPNGVFLPAASGGTQRCGARRRSSAPSQDSLLGTNRISMEESSFWRDAKTSTRDARYPNFSRRKD